MARWNVAGYAKVKKTNVMGSEINTHSSPSLPRYFSVLPLSFIGKQEEEAAINTGQQLLHNSWSLDTPIQLSLSRIMCFLLS